jgi:hypothetical protein
MRLGAQDVMLLLLYRVRCCSFCIKLQTEFFDGIASTTNAALSFRPIATGEKKSLPFVTLLVATGFCASTEHYRASDQLQLTAGFS